MSKFLSALKRIANALEMANVLKQEELTYLREADERDEELRREADERDDEWRTIMARFPELTELQAKAWRRHEDAHELANRESEMGGP